MKIAITSSGTNLDAEVDPRFGRCPYFIIYDMDTDAYESMMNEAGLQGGGAGIQAGQFMKDKGVDIVITGNMGPNASSVLNASNISFIVGVSGTVNDVIKKFKAGEYQVTKSSNVNSHHGMSK